MRTKTIQDFKFEIKTESVIVHYNHQHLSLNNYNQRNKRHLKHFCEAIQNKRKMDINTLYGLAREHKLNVIGIAYDKDGKNKLMW